MYILTYSKFNNWMTLAAWLTWPLNQLIFYTCLNWSATPETDWFAQLNRSQWPKFFNFCYFSYLFDSTVRYMYSAVSVCILFWQLSVVYTKNVLFWSPKLFQHRKITLFYSVKKLVLYIIIRGSNMWIFSDLLHKNVVIPCIPFACCPP